MDDGIRERHGVTVRRSATFGGTIGLALIERDDHIELPKVDEPRLICPDQARYLARKLYHLARRIDQRGAK